MSKLTRNTPKIVSLATQLERDIREKNLSPGAPYLSTLEAAHLLGVSTGAANRAMQLLVKREVLRRRQRSGTFIAEAQASKGGSINRVHLLVHQDFLRAEGLLADGVILGIQGQIPSAEIQFNFLPNGDEAKYAEQVVSEALRTSRSEGFVLVRAPLGVQRVLQQSGLPTVIHGTPFPSVVGVPWIDRDHAQSGQLAAHWIVQQGCRHVSIITREVPLPGDVGMSDAVGAEWHNAGMSAASIHWRPLPMDAQVVGQAALNVISKFGRPHGFICRSFPHAFAVAKALDENGIDLGVDAFIVALDVYKKRVAETPVFPFMELSCSPEEVGAHIGEMLELQARGERPSADSVSIPVVMRAAEREKS